MTGTTKVRTLGESKSWLWKALKAGHRDVANALLFWGRKAPKGARKRLPRELDLRAVRAAAAWVKANRGQVRAWVAKADAAARGCPDLVRVQLAVAAGRLSHLRREPETAVVLADGSGEYVA